MNLAGSTIQAYRHFRFRRKIESFARMSNMSQEDVATGLRTVQQGLEALRDEHGSVCTTIENSLKGISEDEAPIPREKTSSDIRQCNKHFNWFGGGYDDGIDMSHLNNLEAEKQKYQVR
ncbi:hypothetical protein KIN20_008027 [Parelaphostrongylus tenuis]|uniref:Uncharacterized protein n=1 Tax=Parelaphostrongylus tenuis TaxID=148309 RepID=A0AAD5QJJ6_PARTN|nr:hypothetical protein KIN20_008027 [Parelaphostrongylus tenuis]